MNEINTQLVKLMHALGSRSRMKIVMLLAEYGALCVGAISRRTGVSQSAVSQHLRLLSESGVVSSERIGNFIHYRIDRRFLGGCLADLSDELGLCRDRDLNADEEGDQDVHH